MQQLTFKEFTAQRDSRGLRLLDLRELDDRQQGDLPGTEIFPLSELERGTLPEEDGRSLAVLANSSDRAERAAQILKDAGFESPIVITDTIQFLLHTINQLESSTPPQSGPPIGTF